MNLTNSSSDRFIKTYLAVDGPFRNPQGEIWSIHGSMYNTPGSELPPAVISRATALLREFRLAVGMKCDGSGLVVAQGPGHVAVRIFLESGGVYCESI